MDIMNYIKPELIPVAVVCYIVGMVLKNTNVLKDKWIPFALGILSVVLCVVYVFATTPMVVVQDWLMGGFVAIVQGILLAGASTYVNQLIKQGRSEE